MYCDVCMGINSHKCPVCGEQPRQIECPTCGGSGAVAYWAMNLETEEETTVTFEAWSCIPETAEEARSRGQKWHRLEMEKCEECDGTGLIWEEQSW
ncbi:MAG: hypothetical protein IJD91_08120 [Clostridia bacterium]|nr:hypothetical protein [Clostridia bacterium]